MVKGQVGSGLKQSEEVAEAAQSLSPDASSRQSVTRMNILNWNQDETRDAPSFKKSNSGDVTRSKRKVDVNRTSRDVDLFHSVGSPLSDADDVENEKRMNENNKENDNDATAFFHHHHHHQRLKREVIL